MVLLSRCSFVLRRSIRAAPQTVAFRRQFPSRSYSNGPIRDEPEVEDHDWESALPIRPDYEERERRLIEGERLRKESQVARREARREERERRLNTVKQEKLAFQLKLTESWDKFCQVPNLPLEIDKGTEYVGFFGKKRTVSKHLSFADLTLPSGEVVQLCSRRDDDAKRHESFGKIPSHSPVLVRIDETAETEVVNGKRSLVAQEIQMLNEAPEKLIVTKETRFPAEKRHLQIRFHAELNARLRFRSWLKAGLTQGLIEKGFMDVETPTLFKSTPEGAREFLVPTRTQGKAYALTQSPQQYKQALMATGVGRYMQWARCYRDEDSRADRQPEFTQLDMEWAFANAENVKKDVTDIVLKTLTALRPAHSYQDINDERVPLISKIPSTPAEAGEAEAHQITHLTFAECIEKHGIDKPDLRIPGQIHQLSIPEEAKHFVGMISNLEDPLVEAFVFPLKDCPPNTARKFVNMFMSTLPRPMSQNVDGAPSILIFDSSMPLNGFSSIGPEYEHLLEQAASGRELQDGDLVIFQVREKPRGQFTDASTRIGDMRRLLWQALVDGGLMEKPRLGDPGSLQFVWVTEFPMFKPLDAEEPWQAEAAGAGISACHHPFTAPLARDDFDKLFESPLDAKSGAYDLVLNGTEVGGGSVRNHIADIQEFIMRDVLKMPDSRLKSFNHLFMALRAGCPPHAGFALGFDRLCALLTDTTTVRDVIAFPKTMKGEDPFTKSPGKIDDEKLHPYFLKIGRVRREKVLADSWGRIGAAPGQDVVGKDFSIRDDPKYDAPAVPYWGSTGEGVDPRFKALEEGRVEARGREPVEKLDRPSLDLAEWMKQSAEIVGEEEMAAKTPEELQAEYQEYVAGLVAEDALIDEGEMSVYDDEEPPADFQPPMIQNETATSADDTLVEEEEETPEQEESSVEKDGEKEKK